jgi:glycoprotein-N-acetylgalactosamine 3-beta-galactosyltransferase
MRIAWSSAFFVAAGFFGGILLTMMAGRMTGGRGRGRSRIVTDKTNNNNNIRVTTPDNEIDLDLRRGNGIYEDEEIAMMRTAMTKDAATEPSKRRRTPLAAAAAPVHVAAIPAVDLTAADRAQHKAPGPGDGHVRCQYTWTAVAHRHVIGGVRHNATTASECQSACVDDTGCIGVDFNLARQCYLLPSSTAAAGTANGTSTGVGKDAAGVVQETPNDPPTEPDVSCVHYDLKRTCTTDPDDDTIAQSLYDKVRILCWVMTTPANHMTKAIHIQATWGRRCNVLLFVTENDENDGTIPTLVVEVLTGREHLTAKTMSAFKYVYQHHFNDADWFLKADDDTYVILENLRYFLSSQNTREPVYFGQHFAMFLKQGYFSGGAGYILSKQALTRLAERPKGLCHDDDGYEDAEMGRCMELLGVRTGDSRDRLGRTRFHCFTPKMHIHGGYPDWYYQYDQRGGRKGIESISDYAISFHYVSPEDMYNLEFYVYHLRPYGIVSGLQDLNQNKRPRPPVDTNKIQQTVRAPAPVKDEMAEILFRPK